MTGARELVAVRVVPAAPPHVRLSVVGGRTQLDVSLPLDAPIASLIPELVKLVRSRDSKGGQSEDTSAKEAKRTFWELRPAGGGPPLSPDTTLREAGVVNGDLLRLSAERALSAPTLHDDVVDAAARLNKASFAGWDAVAAQWMAFAGVHLSALILSYFLVGDAFGPHRAVLIGFAVVVALALVGVAALAYRSYGQTAVGAALGWAAIPVCAGVGWAALSGWGGYGLAVGCAVLILVLAAAYRAVGTGHWGYLASGVFFGLSGVALVIHEIGVRAELVGVGLAVIATLACLTVPRMTAPMGRSNAPGRADPDGADTMFGNPLEVPVPGKALEADNTAPTAEGVWDRVRSALLTRSARYAGLALGAAAGAAVVLHAQVPVQWSGLVFALTCAATLGLYARRPVSAAERAALLLPAVALCIYTCWSAQHGDQPIPLAAFVVLVLLAVGSAVVGMTRPAGRSSGRITIGLAYLEYLASAALIPLALWIAGVYGRLVA